MDYFIIMIYLFFYRIKLHNAIIWFLFELYSKKIFFTQWVKTKFPFPLNVLSPIPSTKIPVPVDQIPFSHPYFRPIPVPFYPFRALAELYGRDTRTLIWIFRLFWMPKNSGPFLNHATKQKYLPKYPTQKIPELNILSPKKFSIIPNLRSKRFRLVSEQKKIEEWDFWFWPREKWNQSQKMKEEGGGGEGRKRLHTNPSILKTYVRQRTQRLIGLASQTILTCVD